MSAISAKDFINKATRVIEIDGFEHDEKIKIRIKSTSMMGMLITGKIPNSLLSVVNDLFPTSQKGKQPDMNELKTDDIKLMSQIMDAICDDCMVETKYQEIKEYMTDSQKTQIMNEAMGVIEQVTPTVQKQEDTQCN